MAVTGTRREKCHILRKKEQKAILVNIGTHVRYLHMSPVSPQKKDRKATKPTVAK